MKTPSLERATNIIAVVGLNPALQKRFVLDPGVSLAPGHVHRACRPVTTGIGGKGQDVAVAFSCLQQGGDDNDDNDARRHVHVSLLQFVGRGTAGDELVDLLAQRLDDSQQTTTIRTTAALRTCTSIVAYDATTELVEPGGLVTTDEFTALLATIPQLRPKDNDNDDMISAVCFMGSLPPGCPEDAYARIYERIVDDNIMASRSSSTATYADDHADSPPPLCVVDSVAGLEALLAVTDPQRTVLKLNVAELDRLVGPSSSDTSSDEAASGASPEEVVVRAVQKFRRRYGSCHVAVTDGPRPAYLDDGVILRRIPVPTLLPMNSDNETTEMLLFPIGAGDAVAAGLIWAWSHSDGSCLEGAFVFGLACGTASCRNEENSVLDPDVVADLYRQQRTLPSTVLYRHDESS
jgi:fructose-1-phosphate kinase PfkB-like protein